MSSILAVIIIIIILCIFLRPKNKIQKCLNKSIGIFDKNAKLALKYINKKKKLTPIDKISKANIYRYNILQNNTSNSQQFASLITKNYIDALDNIYHRLYLKKKDNNTRNAISQNVINQIGDYVENGPDTPEMNYLQHLTFEVNKQNAKHSKKKANNKQNTIKSNLNDSINYHLDPQNVHDSQVNKDLKRIYDRVNELNITTYNNDIYSEITSHINKSLSKKQAKNALSVLNIMKNNNSYSTTLNGYEYDILKKVWIRANTAKCNDNDSSNEILKTSIVEALKDCVENDNVVCSGGRIARIVNALASMDPDPIISKGTMTYDMYRNDYIKAIQNILDKFIEEKKNDPRLKNAALSYIDINIQPSPSEEKEFKSELKQRIDKCLDAYDVFSENQKKRLRDESYIYADLM